MSDNKDQKETELEKSKHNVELEEAAQFLVQSGKKLPREAGPALLEKLVFQKGKDKGPSVS